MKQESEEIQEYFNSISSELKSAYEVAKEARKLGLDPENKVDIPIANNMAERVEGLISADSPELLGTGLTKRIQELEDKYGALAWEVAIQIALEVAQEKFCKFKSKIKAMETGIRTGMAYSTAGIVSAPLEGFVELKIKKRLDGKEYFALSYAGPIRGAGGTAAAFSVVIADCIRKKMMYETYDPTEQEVKRFVSELYDYHERVTNLQYLPSEEEIEFLAKHLPIEIDGEPTEKFDVSNYKDLPRVETNKIRGGVCLVMGEGVAQKAAKLWKRLQKWENEFNIDWGFLKEFLELQKRIKAKQEKEEKQEKIMPNYTYIKDLVAGRPVLTHPMRAGGFRLRYGRTRTTGFSSSAINPALQHVLNKYIATGTQLKLERPGKATAVTICENIEGPIVKLENGNVVQLSTTKEAYDSVPNIKEILFLGDILISYGDFSENGHCLIPPGYCEEWYAQEFEKACVDIFGSLDLDKISSNIEISADSLKHFLREPIINIFDFQESFHISQKLGIPLHPKYTYHWNLIKPEQLLDLTGWLNHAKFDITDRLQKIILPMDERKRILELIGLPHIVATEYVVVEKDHAQSLFTSLGRSENMESIKEKISELIKEGKGTLEIINLLSPITIRDKSGIFIGARMGRPEKAKMRRLTGQPHVLFPVGDEGGRLRCFQSALEAGTISSVFPVYFCAKCRKETIYGVCEECGETTEKRHYCRECGIMEKKECPRHGPCTDYRPYSIDIKHYFTSSLKKLNMATFPDLIKGVKGTSNKDHVPENIAKGILRAKHDIYVNKDGTTRYDMTELPITHFKPKEIGTPVRKLKELGYKKDIKGKELESEDQILEIRPQDVILPGSAAGLAESADNVLFRIGQFIDELLAKIYNKEPYYNFKAKEDVVGCLVIGLAPHTSAGIVGRVIGFSQTQGFFTHPMFHAAMRRDCDGDEACVILLMDALLNFSRKYLPDKRGSRTMDSPLVLTTKLVPAEVDDMVLGLDIVSKYPLEFYKAAMELKYPWEVEIEQVKKRLGTPGQYEGYGFTHDVSNINAGIPCSAYKTLPSMEEKLKGQMDLAEKIRAVDAKEIARLVIEKHFLKDTRGNLRKFSMQQFRCSKCNEKFRRPPLVGKCTKCGGNLMFTISEGSIIKYLKPSISLAEKYDVDPYLRQVLEITQKRVDEVFGKEKETQSGLGNWFKT